ncbi:tyrosine-type recombinase/integrase [Geothrix paludis]|uniref:tyrosine-type recombinase/integrase n=1 Tax=Geothrix paludis TaxID=2922722 RepID=UPI001FAC9770|nr:site-specific integrase [Geothrix paludis]
MARTKRSAALGTRNSRLALEMQRDHTETLSAGRYLIYRRPGNGANGSWVARLYDPKTRKMSREPLGHADDFLESDGIKVLDYKQACTKAGFWFKERERRALLAEGGDIPHDGPYTVVDAMRDYLVYLRKKGSRSLSIIETTINAHILPVLGATPVEGLTKKRIDEWRVGLAETGRRKTGRVREEPEHLPAPTTPEEMRKRRDTSNRILTNLKAALNLAHQDGKVQGAAPWRDVKPFKNVGNSRVRFLQGEEPRLLVEACEGDFKSLVIGGLASGARYGELGRCRVKDFSAKPKTLFIEFGKNGKSRYIHLDDEAVAWFASFTKGRDSEETLFRHTGVDRVKRKVSDDWMPYDQVHLMKKAWKKAGITKVTFHELRHTYASNLILQGMQLLYVAAQLGHSDTRMVEKYYGHLVPSAVAMAVKKHGPKLGIFEGSKENPLDEKVRVAKKSSRVK